MQSSYLDKQSDVMKLASVIQDCDDTLNNLQTISTSLGDIASQQDDFISIEVNDLNELDGKRLLTNSGEIIEFDIDDSLVGHRKLRTLDKNGNYHEIIDFSINGDIATSITEVEQIIVTAYSGHEVELDGVVEGITESIANNTLLRRACYSYCNSPNGMSDILTAISDFGNAPFQSTAELYSSLVDNLNLSTSSILNVVQAVYDHANSAILNNDGTISFSSTDYHVATVWETVSNNLVTVAQMFIGIMAVISKVCAAISIVAGIILQTFGALIESGTTASYNYNSSMKTFPVPILQVRHTAGETIVNYNWLSGITTEMKKLLYAYGCICITIPSGIMFITQQGMTSATQSLIGVDVLVEAFAIIGANPNNAQDWTTPTTGMPLGSFCPLNPLWSMEKASNDTWQLNVTSNFNLYNYHHDDPNYATAGRDLYSFARGTYGNRFEKDIPEEDDGTILSRSIYSVSILASIIGVPYNNTDWTVNNNALGDLPYLINNIYAPAALVYWSLYNKGNKTHWLNPTITWAKWINEILPVVRTALSNNQVVYVFLTKTLPALLDLSNYTFSDGTKCEVCTYSPLFIGKNDYFVNLPIREPGYFLTMVLLSVAVAAASYATYRFTKLRIQRRITKWRSNAYKRLQEKKQYYDSLVDSGTATTSEINSAYTKYYRSARRYNFVNSLFGYSGVNTITGSQIPGNSISGLNSIAYSTSNLSDALSNKYYMALASMIKNNVTPV